MSSRSDERALQNQVAELRDELRRLQLRVDRQEDQLLEVSRELEESRELSFSAGEAPSSIASATSVSGGYSIVTPVPGPTVAGVLLRGLFVSRWPERSGSFFEGP